MYTTFNSPHGRCRYLRHPSGVIYAQGIFQKKVDETFRVLPGVIGVANGIVIYGCNNEANLKAVMNVLEKSVSLSMNINAR